MCENSSISIIINVYTGMYIVIDLPMTTTSIDHDWFQKAKANDRNYRDYYIWTSDQVNDGRYWSVTSNSKTNDSYMHYDGKPNMPILNWRNDNVQNAIMVC